ncbi:hypothetical protein, partial [Acidithiobacillus caldus]|uniref:hypothetical protein n=1 Tax=Acidithiobacillus caldus TaxID=33059 RepID=UPI001C07B6D7
MTDENKNQHLVVITAVDQGNNNVDPDRNFKLRLQCVLTADDKIADGYWYGVIKEADENGAVRE